MQDREQQGPVTGLDDLLVLDLQGAIGMERPMTLPGQADPPGQAEADGSTLELSVVMPCLNEAETLATCVSKAQHAIRRLGIEAEILVADNGSSDGSQAIALALGARLVPIPTRGYGAALMGGIAAARGRYVIFADADDSYDFQDLEPFLTKLREGYELVMGNRFRGENRAGAMPALHRYVGTPALTWIGHLFYGSPVHDFNCGMRGLHRTSVARLGLRAPGMEFASEMVVKAQLHGLRVAEVPTTLWPDGRTRAPHLRPWRDGWRHLRLLLLHSPAWLYFYPGVGLTLAGLLAGAFVLAAPGPVGDSRTLAVWGCCLGIVVGHQSIVFALLMTTFAVDQGLLPRERALHRLSRNLNLELGLCLGVALLAVGGAGLLMAGLSGSGSAAHPGGTAPLAAGTLTCMAVGADTALGSFFLGLLRMRGRTDGA